VTLLFGFGFGSGLIALLVLVMVGVVEPHPAAHDTTAASRTARGTLVGRACQLPECPSAGAVPALAAWRRGKRAPFEERPPGS